MTTPPNIAALAGSLTGARMLQEAAQDSIEAFKLLHRGMIALGEHTAAEVCDAHRDELETALAAYLKEQSHDGQG